MKIYEIIRESFDYEGYSGYYKNMIIDVAAMMASKGESQISIKSLISLLNKSGGNFDEHNIQELLQDPELQNISIIRDVTDSDINIGDDNQMTNDELGDNGQDSGEVVSKMAQDTASKAIKK